MSTQLETMHRAIGLLTEAMAQVSQGQTGDVNHTAKGVTALMIEMTRGQQPMPDLNGDAVEALAVTGAAAGLLWEAQLEVLRGRTGRAAEIAGSVAGRLGGVRWSG